MFTRIALAVAAVAAISFSVFAQDTTSQVGKHSCNDKPLPPPLISNAEAAAFNKSYDSIQIAILAKRANNPRYNCAVPALESIIHDWPKTLAMATAEKPAYQVVKEMYEAELVARQQKSEREAREIEIANVQ